MSRLRTLDAAAREAGNLVVSTGLAGAGVVTGAALRFQEEAAPCAAKGQGEGQRAHQPIVASRERELLAPLRDADQLVEEVGMLALDALQVVGLASLLHGRDRVLL